MADPKDYRPEEKNLRRNMRLEVKREVIILFFHKDPPDKMKLKKGVSVTLLDETPGICATTERLATGPRVRIDPKQKVEIEDRFLGKSVTIPAQYLRVHPDEI